MGSGAHFGAQWLGLRVWGLVRLRVQRFSRIWMAKLGVSMMINLLSSALHSTTITLWSKRTASPYAFQTLFNTMTEMIVRGFCEGLPLELKRRF